MKKATKVFEQISKALDSKCLPKEW
jgi:hypothetical protein